MPENRKTRDILIEVEAHLKYIGEQITDIKNDKTEQWGSIDKINRGLNRVIGVEGVITIIVIGMLIRLIAF